ncbi:MAG: hypothetical protein WA131_04965 [Desulfitobacteriaceae bacterium]
MKRLGESCILEDHLCTECGECDHCELNPQKICDNCCQCIEKQDVDYIGIKIDDILLNIEDKKKVSSNFKNSKRSFKIKPKS